MSNSSIYFKKLNAKVGEPPRKRKCKLLPHLPPVALPSFPPIKTRLGDEFFNQESSLLANALLGKVLVRQINNGEHICGRIVETEAYLGMVDKAAHSSCKRSVRTEPMFMKPGTVYVFSIYGMYHCFNISSGGEGKAVLIRAIEPLSGFERMQQIRSESQKKSCHGLPTHQLCNGPSKLCLSFGITKEFNKVDLADPSSRIWIEDWSPQPEFVTVTSTRIGLSKKAAEWIDAPLRFYVSDSKSVSVLDKSKKT
ncbi:DNA-3-methyladenine glycosylase-like [Daphnia carinata]|uniref:DNA-3-methyladenine glycosylase-like n=1 Tax=Daphnia carinata TaxID=120202 RepID=UPI00257A4306|nr:DNA-3-methyladenine glycosylase-like [Daphnia carinata]XP_057370876.1 DNA-3-methyladenine glycosylase-like [Daphnia carinata]